MARVKVVIVDGDPEVLHSLEQTIDWEGLDCETVGTAGDGDAGKEMILKNRPDIVLTDIDLPGTDGLTMIREVRNELPKLTVIILTECRQFESALRAIRQGVFDYLLKPADPDEIENTVRRALAEQSQLGAEEEVLARADRYQAKAQLLSLLTNESHTGQDVSRMMDEAGLSSEAYYLMIFQPEEGGCIPGFFLKEMENLLGENRVTAVSVILYDCIVLYARRNDTSDAWAEEAKAFCGLMRKRIRTGMNIGISRLETSKHRIRQAYQDARQALYENAMGNRSETWTFYNENTSRKGGQLVKMRHRVEMLVEQADLTDENADMAAAELIRLSASQYGQLRGLLSLYAMLLSKKYPRNQSAAVDRALSLTWFVNGEEQVAFGLRQVYAALRENRDTSENQCSLLIRDVLDYVRLHGADKLSLNDVAERFHVSANYLSALVRKETGITFHNHIINVKMDIAHTMLADPRILVEEVAYAVGYSNYVSFYNVFKQKEGMTPTEYRNRLAR